MECYESYKDSGIEWIGEIPEDTNIVKMSHCMDSSLGKMLTTSANSEDFFLASYLRAANIKENGFDLTDVKEMYFKDEERSLYCLDKGDLIVVEGGNVALAQIWQGDSGRIFIQNALHRVRALPISNNRFLKYCLDNARFSGFINLICNKATIAHFTKEKLASVPVVLFSVEEQQAIADYLDAKTKEIDEIVSETEQSIELLQEYRKSVISEAVTKGLDPNVPMKDSGIEWIGEIPEVWNLVRFKNILQERNEKNFPIKSDERLSLSIDKGVTLYAEKTTNLDRFKDDVSQYKLAYIGDFVMNSMNMIVGAIGVSSYFGCVSPAYYVFYDNEKDHITSRYCDYVFHSKTLQQVLFGLGKGIMAIDRGDGRVNTCRLKVSRDDLKNLTLPLPSVAIQHSIVNYLDAKTAEIDELIADKQNQVELLKEYRKSLISEVVTGKFKVPNL